MSEAQSIARSEFVLGGQKSGKSRRAEMAARQWQLQSPSHRAVLVATAQAWDEEMRQRIFMHQTERAARVPGMITVEEPLALGDAIAQNSSADTLVVIDCLTLWLTNLLMPAEGVAVHDTDQHTDRLLDALRGATGPLVIVGNEIGLGVIPMGRETRAFVDALGRLNQRVAAACDRVTLMAAGLPLSLKGQP
ncbi:MAG: bifunctional adenosylcobinamide kinase/adenosylcobinamide-phosphate guanylyltransferase [Pseudomonadota bacterium]